MQYTTLAAPHAALCCAALRTPSPQGGVSSVSPKRFKWQLAKFAPQFGGYAQQDSQARRGNSRIVCLPHGLAGAQGPERVGLSRVWKV